MCGTRGRESVCSGRPPSGPGPRGDPCVFPQPTLERWKPRRRQPSYPCVQGGTTAVVFIERLQRTQHNTLAGGQTTEDVKTPDGWRRAPPSLATSSAHGSCPLAAPVMQHALRTPTEWERSLSHRRQTPPPPPPVRTRPERGRCAGAAAAATPRTPAADTAYQEKHTTWNLCLSFSTRPACSLA